MKERISATLDGHEDAQGLESVLESIKETQESRDRWRTYCLIGDALRAETALRSDLTAGVMRRLESEPTVLAPTTSVPSRQRTPGIWRKVLPLAASVAGVAAVGWVALQLNQTDADPAVIQVAAKRPAITVASNPVTSSALNSDDSLRTYVFAHQSSAGLGAMPGVAPYVRTVAEVSQGLK